MAAAQSFFLFFPLFFLFHERQVFFFFSFFRIIVCNNVINFNICISLQCSSKIIISRILYRSDDSGDEIDDHDINKILIVMQTPPALRKHPQGDRTGDHTKRSKITAELGKVINDGLFYYEKDLWDSEYAVIF